MGFLNELWETVATCYSKTEDPIERVLETYELFDQVHEIDDKSNKTSISCKKGCSHCCYLHVTITPDEGEYLTAKAKEFGVDTEVLEKQSKYNDAFEWLKMPLAGRKCVFLEDGVCGIYEDRPLSCRNYRVTGESKKCDTGKGNILVAQVLYPLAEWVHCVAMSLNGGTQESMAYGINKRLKSNRV